MRRYQGVVARSLDSRRKVEVEVERRRVDYGPMEIEYRVLRRLSAASIFGDRECTILGGGRVRARYQEYVKA